MNKIVDKNEQLPIIDRELFNKMKNIYTSKAEDEFFKKMEYKEIYEYPVSSFDVILSEYDNDDNLYVVKCYTSEYLIGRTNKDKDINIKLNTIPTTLTEALNEDLFILLGEHITLWEWLKRCDYAGLNYNYEWEE